MKKIVTFGEIMLRLAPNGYNRFFQDDQLQATIGGGEANVDVDPDKVVIVLTDHGPGIADVEKAMQEGWSTAPDNVRSLGFGAGMGLPNMKKYSDEMTIDSVVGQGTTLKMVVYAQSEKS